MIKTRRNFFTLYLPAVLLVTAWLFLIRLKINPTAGTVLVIGLCFCSFFWLSIINSTPLLQVDTAKISARFLFRREEASLDDILLITPNSKESCWVSRNAFSSTEIRFRDGHRWLLLQYGYDGLGKWLSRLAEIRNDRFQPELQNESRIVSSILPATFAGNIFSSINAYLLLLLPILAGYPARPGSGGVKTTMIIILAGYLLLLIGRLMYYFEADEQGLIIRNHIFRWYYRRFSFGEIYEADKVVSFRYANALKITTNRFRFHRFAADSLRQKDWKRLLQMFEEAGVPVNEGI